MSCSSISKQKYNNFVTTKNDLSSYFKKTFTTNRDILGDFYKDNDINYEDLVEKSYGNDPSQHIFIPKGETIKIIDIIYATSMSQSPVSYFVKFSDGQQGILITQISG